MNALLVEFLCGGGVVSLEFMLGKRCHDAWSVAQDGMREAHWESWQLTRAAETPRSVIVAEVFMLWLMSRLNGPAWKDST